MARPASLILRRVLLATLAVLLAMAVGRTYIGDVYPVQSTSMEPTLHASPERVFVRYERGFTPRRFDLVVFSAPAPDSGAVVKRAAGLPGESVLLSGGDLLIEGRRLGVEVPRPMPVVIFDSRIEPLEGNFSAPTTPMEPAPNGWGLDARGRREDLAYTRRARDDRYTSDGIHVPGRHEVNDLGIEGRFVFKGSGKFSLRLSEEGDAFELELDLRDGVVLAARLQRRSGMAELAVLASVDRPGQARAGEPCSVRLENVDNILIAEVAGQILHASYETNTPLMGVVDEDHRHLQPRVHLAVAEIELGIERLLVVRDFYYTVQGPIGTGSPVSLGPDEIFALGDNSADSRDSREFGPIRLVELAGRATRVLWPFSAARHLGGLRSLLSVAEQ